MRRVPQPPINPAARPLETREFWPGFIAAVIGLVLAYSGARHFTKIETVDGGTASEIELVRAYAFGGLQFGSKVAPPPPPRPIPDNPAATAEAMYRWEQQRAEFKPPTWKVRVDTAAAAPCPT